jgi:hypothetical protein
VDYFLLIDLDADHVRTPGITSGLNLRKVTGYIPLPSARGRIPRISSKRVLKTANGHSIRNPRMATGFKLTAARYKGTGCAPAGSSAGLPGGNNRHERQYEDKG